MTASSPSLARKPAPAPALRVAPAPAVSPITGSDLTVIVEVDPDPAKLEALTKLLKATGEDLENETLLRLRQLRLVHFMRWVVIPPQAAGGPHLLAFCSDFDGTRAEHLNELWKVCGAGLAKIYGYCKDSPKLARVEDLHTYFDRHVYRAAAAYSGTRDQSADQIRSENDLQVAVADYLDTPDGREASERSPLAAVKAFAEKPSTRTLDVSEPPRCTWTTLSKLAHGWARYPLLGAAVLTLGVPGVLFLGAVGLRELTERSDDRDFKEPDADQLDLLKSREDHRKLVQNQLTHVVDIKPGWFRMKSLQLVLFVIDFLARNYFDRGDLGGIPSIHYARWVILEDQRRLLFFSNFDGSWESYLGDFVDQAATGLTAVWSNTVGFPLTRFLLGAGARDEESFKNWTRHHQIETQLWYSAYPTLTVQNVNDNTRLRAGLSREPEGDALAEWLRAL